MLFTVYNENSDDKSITISEPGINFFCFISIDVWYPYSWKHNITYVKICSSKRFTFNANLCKEKLITHNTLSITYWSHTYDS